MQINRIFIFLLIAVVLLCGCGQAPLDAPTASGQTPVAQDLPEGLYFLGDSTTAHMRTRAPIQNRDHIWATKERYLNLDAKILQAQIEDTDGSTRSIAEMAQKYRPRYLLVTLGVDYGVYYFRKDLQKFCLCYEKLLNAVSAASPETQVIIGSIFPVAPHAVVGNDMIDPANKALMALAKRRGIWYVDNNSILKNAKGALDPKYQSGDDGIHLNALAYERIFDNLKTFFQTKGVL